MAEAVVLCGGQGWRLKPDTWVPKPLLQLPDGKTLIQHQVEFLAEHDFERIILATRKGMIPTSQLDWPPSVEVIASEEGKKLGTGGAVKNAFQSVDAGAYVMNVDDIILGPYDPSSLQRCGAPAVLLLSHARSSFGTVDVDNAGFVTGFQQKPLLEVYVSVGHYFFQTHVVSDTFPEIGDFENTVMGDLATKRWLKASVLPNQCRWITINTYKDYQRALHAVQTTNTNSLSGLTEDPSAHQTLQAHSKHRHKARDGRDTVLKIWVEHGGGKIECRYSSTDDTWIGFCKLCHVSRCVLAEKSKKEIIDMTRRSA